MSVWLHQKAQKHSKFKVVSTLHWSWSCKKVCRYLRFCVSLAGTGGALAIYLTHTDRPRFLPKSCSWKIKSSLLTSLLKCFVQEVRLLCSAWPGNLKTYGFYISGEHLIGMEARFPSRDKDPKTQETNIQKFKFFPDMLCVYLPGYSV